MKVAVTGSSGFVGKNLTIDLKHTTEYEVLEINRLTPELVVKENLLAADFIVHLAGVNRPKKENEFEEGNVSLLENYLEIIKESKKTPTILLASSTQAEKDNPYGVSKREAEILLKKFSNTHGNEVLIYRFPNIFGKWCKPNYNSVVATFCYNITRNKDIVVNDRNVVLTLNYIDDILREIKKAMSGVPTIENGAFKVPNTYQKSLGEIVELLYSFKSQRTDKTVPNLTDGFEKNLYSTYLSYLPTNQFSYPLHMNVDDRGSFTEFLKTPDRGQVSVNISKPGVTKGNHWHHTKNEKFLVVSGEGVIRFRLLDDSEVIEYFVSGETLEVVDIPVGYTHNIENLGQTDMVTLMWANEVFDANDPDTYFLEV